MPSKIEQLERTDENLKKIEAIEKIQGYYKNICRIKKKREISQLNNSVDALKEMVIVET